MKRLPKIFRDGITGVIAGLLMSSVLALGLAYRDGSLPPMNAGEVTFTAILLALGIASTGLFWNGMFSLSCMLPVVLIISSVMASVWNQGQGLVFLSAFSLTYVIAVIASLIIIPHLPTEV